MMNSLRVIVRLIATFSIFLTALLFAACGDALATATPDSVAALANAQATINAATPKLTTPDAGATALAAGLTAKAQGLSTPTPPQPTPNYMATQSQQNYLNLVGTQNVINTAYAQTNIAATKNASTPTIAPPTATPAPTSTPKPTPTNTPLPPTATSTPNIDATVAAKATVDRKDFLTWAKSHAPTGTFTAQSDDFGIVVGELEYKTAIGYSNAGANTKYIVMQVGVKNLSDSRAYTNPNYFTLVALDGQAVGYDTATFEYDQPFNDTDLPPNSYAVGFLVFKVPQDAIPAQVVYNPAGFLQDDVTVVIVKP